MLLQPSILQILFTTETLLVSQYTKYDQTMREIQTENKYFEGNSGETLSLCSLEYIYISTFLF